MRKNGISRRRFMKDGFSLMSGTSLSLRALSRPDQDKKKIGVSVSRTSLKSLTAIPTTCQQCSAGCGVIAYLNGDRLVQILGNPEHPINKGGICAKGVAGINLVNDPERLLYPVKRLGQRGENRWSRITWDEAYHTLSTRVSRLIDEEQTERFIVDLGYPDFILEEFILALGQATVIHRPYLKNVNRSSAFAYLTGHSSFIPDVTRSRTILNFGANPFANHDYFVGIARRLALARIEKGAKLITFDVRMSETAAKSDEWYPVKPGTDGSIALAMANVIVNKGLVDKPFLENRADMSYEVLQEHLSRYTPEWTQRESGVAAKDIERMAIQFASQKPSVAILGGGAYDHENGYQTTRCISLLNWLVGNVGKEGGIFFSGLPLSQLSYTTKTRTISRLKNNNTSIDTYFCYLSNPAYEDPECDKSAVLLKDEKTTRFLVVMDTHMTETAMLADLVLPAATYLESWGVEPGPPLDGISMLNLRQPAVSLLSPAEALRSPSFDVGKLTDPTFQPLGEAKEVGNVFLKLAKDLDGNVVKTLPYKDTQDYASQMVSLATQSKGAFQDLKQKGFWTNPKSNAIIEESLAIERQLRLPDYMPVNYQEKTKPNQFILTTFKTNLGTKGMENSKWAREIFHENRLWLNKQKAAQLGIQNGDKVRVSSSVGSVILHVLTTNRIHPESVALAEGLGHTAFGSMAQARKSKSKDRDTELIWWGKKGKGVNPFSIIADRVDPMGRGLASKDTVVHIEKLGE
ncbi:MAG: molybdopterin-dependent oxidoreductase [Candidatus Aminicenantes bacterium]|nr:MAG: molybdopterin-dependent oxidoreductase [Candidatus Aminicenantes bacterium]